MSEIRNQLQTLTGSAITSDQLGDVGGKVFTNALDSQADLISLVKWWRSIHLPTFGTPIPGSATTKTGSGDGPMLAPITNQTMLINALALTNADAANPAAVSLTIDGVQVAEVVIDPSATANAVGAGSQAIPTLTLADGHTLSMAVSGVAASDVSFGVAYSLLVQG